MIICLPTPLEILKDDGIDIFNKICGELDVSEDMKTELSKALWGRYAERMLRTSPCDHEYEEWITRFVYRINRTLESYLVRFDLYDKFKGALTDYTDQQTDGTEHYENEDLPENVIATAQKYLSERSDRETHLTVRSKRKSEIVADLMERVKSPYEEWSMQASFESMFVGWY